MDFTEFLYRVGLAFEKAAGESLSAIVSFFLPKPRKNPPEPGFLRRPLKKGLTAHELISLEVQLVILTYLAASLLTVLLGWVYAFGVITILSFFALRYVVVSNREFVIDFPSYRFFYCGLFVLSAVSFAGYLLLRATVRGVYYYYAYLIGVLAVVLVFRWAFRSRYGRDYTYGIVEEVKGGLIRVFVHDDIGANVKPGRYWVPAVPDAEPGRIVKLLVEERAMRSSIPVRVLEVYLDQSSQTETEPKEETE
ncbi:DUF2101 family protein [Thermococcus sp.]|uniref:DUF2101 family protein n=1 Tax=Thermococcus sp. TaxID=35749 RepID=UPI0026289924|nr:DUF2101 family protein [Thermococcus sp.]